MAGTIDTIWSSRFGSADIEPPIVDAVADGGTQPFLQCLYVAVLHEQGTDQSAEAAQLELAARLADKNIAEGRQIIEETFRDLGGYALAWLR